MNRIKSFDLFQKITSKEIIQSTITGAILSTVGVFLIFFLIFIETMEYLTPSIKKETIIYQDKSATDSIKVNFSMKFSSLPCSIISIDQEDQIGTHSMNIQENIQKIRYSKENKKIIGTNTAYQLGPLEQSINDHEACYISGFVKINKAPGDIHISFHDYRNVWEYLVHREDSYAKINMDHIIYSLSFGDKEIKTEIFDKFGLNEFTQHFQGHQLQPSSNLPDDINKYNYDYYIKLIPHIFIDETTSKEYFTYQYSHSQNKNQVEEIENEMPIVTMHYDISPITIKTTLHKKHFTKFLIHICAIVGGVFVVFGLINSVIFYLFVDIAEWNGREKQRWEN